LKEYVLFVIKKNKINRIREAILYDINEEYNKLRIGDVVVAKNIPRFGRCLARVKIAELYKPIYCQPFYAVQGDFCPFDIIELYSIDLVKNLGPISIEELKEQYPEYWL
jgi:hypothetical protein